MQTWTREDLDAMVGRPLFGPADHKIGKISHVYDDERSHRPEWLAVSGGLFGLKTMFVPLAEIQLRAEDESKPPYYVGPYDKETIKAAPVADIDRPPTPDEMDRLAAHYGISRS